MNTAEPIQGYDIESLGGMIENEGLEYFFLDYLSPSKIQDEALRDAAHLLNVARDRLVERLEELGVVL